MNHTSPDQLTTHWNLSRGGDISPHPNMDAWTGRGIPEHNYLIGGTTRVEGNERRLTDIENNIHNIFVQITKVDQDAVTDNRFLMHKLTQLEEAFDENLTQEINNLTNNNADAWKNFDEKENENLTRWMADMDETEKDVQSQSADLESLTNYVKGMEANLEMKNKQLSIVPAREKIPMKIQH